MCDQKETSIKFEKIYKGITKNTEKRLQKYKNPNPTYKS